MQTLKKNLCYLQSHRHIPRCVQCFLHSVAVKHICSKITCRLELFSVDESVVLFLKVLVEIDSSTSFLFTVQPPMYALCNNEEEEFSSCLATYTLWVLFFHFALPSFYFPVIKPYVLYVLVSVTCIACDEKVGQSYQS